MSFCMFSKESLVSSLTDVGLLKSPNIIQAFLSVERKDFIPEKWTDYAYDDRPLPIGFEQTISQPSVVAFMLELLSPKEGESVLDVGSGSGWTTALLAYIVGEKGCVRGVEIIPELVIFGRRNLQKYRFPQASIAQASDHLGIPEDGPFDRILVSAEATKIPKELLDQLCLGGTLIVPIRDGIARICKISKTKSTKKFYPGFVFVPLREQGERYKR